MISSVKEIDLDVDMHTAMNSEQKQSADNATSNGITSSSFCVNTKAPTATSIIRMLLETVNSSPGISLTICELITIPAATIAMNTLNQKTQLADHPSDGGRNGKHSTSTATRSAGIEDSTQTNKTRLRDAVW
ncbi:unnamed protein product [Phytophthora fragariaefolia]|uniref:Unnamed protein product n=1 Tax=Phytophthora fragariaefolia TaxID=1490495 RepID=A0A9W6YEX6_9STRA|nr:unnamed protein product [Phytophthora fragariaefolia]